MAPTVLPITRAVGAPVADGAALAALREDLTRGEYVSARVADLLGPVAAEALTREDPAPARRALRGREDPRATLISLFTLGDPVQLAAARAALPGLGIGRAEDIGLLVVEAGSGPDSGTGADTDTDTDTDPDTHTGVVRALVDLDPYSAEDAHGEIAWWIASDLTELATGAPLRDDHVLGVGGASLTLVRITPRTPVDRVLDLGCGCGIQAMHASRHAQVVVATDLSERALAFAAFNARLNGIELDLRQGSLFEPVAGERFDLIVSNPPFVITPRDAGIREWTYRDGGEAGDALTAHVLRDLPEHLTPGGTAAMLGNWEIPRDEPWDTHPRAWADGLDLDLGSDLDLDLWCIQREQEDPARYAETWARDGGITARDERWSPMITAWLDDFATRDVGGIGFGYLVAARPLAPRPAVHRFEAVASSGNGDLGAHLARGLRLLGSLASVDDDTLAASRPVRAADVRERRHLVPGAWDPEVIELIQGAGFGRTVRADQLLAAVVGAADGELGCAQILGAVCALTGEDPADARPRLLDAVRELVRIGMLDLEPVPGGAAVHA